MKIGGLPPPKEQQQQQQNPSKTNKQDKLDNPDKHNNLAGFIVSTELCTFSFHNGLICNFKTSSFI